MRFALDFSKLEIFEHKPIFPIEGRQPKGEYTMQNVQIKVDGKGIMTITCDLGMAGELSKSGKSTVIASTQGNQAVGTGKGGDTVKVGLNVYKSA